MVALRGFPEATSHQHLGAGSTAGTGSPTVRQGAPDLPCIRSKTHTKRAGRICLLEVHLIELRTLLERHHHGLRSPKKLTLDNFPFFQSHEVCSKHHRFAAKQQGLQAAHPSQCPRLPGAGCPCRRKGPKRKASALELIVQRTNWAKSGVCE